MNSTFTISGYKHMLQIALNSEYAFCSFPEIRTATGYSCVLRHDIDTDLNAALEMAKIEADLGIKATYFLMLRSPVYNLFSRANHSFVQQIIKLGHHIGLHYDEGFYPNLGVDLNTLIEMEAQVLNLMFDIKVEVVSFHQPGLAVLSNSFKLKSYINTYDKQDLSDTFYLSDSNKVWKNESAFEIFENKTHKKIHLLIHPMWWITDREIPTDALWNKVLNDNITRNLQQIIETERAFGAQRSIKIIHHE